MGRNLLLFLFLLAPVLACSQNIISGTVTDSAHVPIGRLTVSYSKMNSTVVTGGFTQTNQSGQFRLQINVPQDSIELHLAHLSYEDKWVRLKNLTASYNFIMAPKIRALSAVNISAPPVYKRNDTINYSVEPFTLKQDRVIAAVIKKLPGVEMDGDKILYQGKPIQKYYINGLDLLESGYAIANNNLPIEAVKKIQIIENNQPVKILDSVIFSDRASINIQLKKLTTTGTGKIGVGLAPALWDVNLTPMTFNRNFQAINTFQANNVGDNVSRQLDALTQSDLYEVMELSDLPVRKPLSLFTVQEPSSPFFNEKKWLVNRTFLLNSNTLQKLKNDYELKINVSYVNDTQQRTGSTYTTYYTPNENINISENITNRYNTNRLRGNIIFSKNEKNIYLKNNFQFSKSWLNTTGNLLRNDYDAITQNLGLQDFDFSNRFTTLKFIGSRLFTFNSLISVSQTPQLISVTPGQFESLLNSNIPYSKLDQQVYLRNFMTDDYFSFIQPIKQFTILARIGALVQNQALQSELYTSSGGNPMILGSDFSNAIHLNTLSAYAELKTQYKSQRWRLDLN
ncbi:MAG: carboxypeptidase regulatory-like domain-containing protein, partial [Sphingobacteriaceae bacterium]